MNSLALTAKIAGWDWTPMVEQPLLWLVTLPLHLLPAAWVPWSLNFFAAVTAALTLGLLARTVQLLPWDRPLSETNLPLFSVPIFLAAAVCGLEFSFWREATAATGEMLDLLLLATVLWLLLEYRVRRESRWLDAAVFVWGLGMSENWLMQLTLPLFIAGVIWLRGIRFFRAGSILRLAGLGLAGFSFYALLPLINGLAPHSPWSLGQAWLVSLKQSKNLVVVLYYQFWVSHRLLAVAVALYFLVPTLSFLTRMHDEGTRRKSRVDRFQIWIYRGLRALLLLACLWLAFDPTIGLRQIIQRQFGVSLSLLTFDYLNALGAAFLVGNLLLISQDVVKSRRHWWTRIPWRQFGLSFAFAGLVLVIASLTVRNAPAILRVNLHPLQRYGELAVESLPAGHGILLSDEPQKLTVFQAALATRRNGPDWLAVDTHALPAVAYRAWLDQKQSLGWLTDDTQHELKPAETLRLLEHIARTNRLYYLHPSYGCFFERFYLEPKGNIYEMKLRETNSLEIPELPGTAVDANETYWNNTWKKDLAAFVPAPGAKPGLWRKKIERLGFTPASLVQDLLLAEWYSLSLDSWAVTLQQQGRLKAARLRFEQALQLNTNNLSAQISVACNTNLQSGRELSLVAVEQVAGEWGNLPRLAEVINNNGPFDEPVFCYLLGGAFQKNGFPLQALQQFERTLTLVPGAPAPEFALAELYTQLRFIDRARPLINHLRDVTKKISPNSAVDLELSLLEASSWLLQTNAANARSALKAVLLRHPGDALVEKRVLNAYLAFGDYSNALQLVEAQLSKTPDDVPSLNSEAAILIQSGKASAAIPVLTHVLTLTNLPEVRLNRAVAQLICRDISAAETDFRELEKSGVEPVRVSYGLATIAEHRHDTNQAVRYLRFCLTNTAPDSLFWHQANARLKALEPGPFLPMTNKTVSSANE